MRDKGYVIAADSGMDHALALGVEVDLLVGDLDSVLPESIPLAKRVERHPWDKDVTDLELALLAALESTEGPHSMDAYQTVEIIKALQADPATGREDLFRVEWAYLRLLDRHSDAAHAHDDATASGSVLAGCYGGRAPSSETGVRPSIWRACSAN